MPLPVVLELFDCGEDGLETPVSFGGKKSALETTSFFKDAMPLVAVPSETVLENLVAGYNTEFDTVDFQIGSFVERNHATSAEKVVFDEYHLTYNNNLPQPVFALTTGHLYYLHDEKSYEDLLSGAKPGPGEIILILKPSIDALQQWPATHPGRSCLLEECAYLNVQLPSDEDLKAQIRRSASEEYLKKLHKNIIGTEWPGTGDWASAYLQNFYQYPDWPILVDGGTQVALTQSNPDLISEQLVRMSFKVNGTWNAHYDFVKLFFTYHQRGPCLSGHPLIARLLGYSVEAGTVDIIPLYGEGQYALSRLKYYLIKDFKYNLTQPGPEYHPLAIEADEDPQCITVPVSSAYVMSPTLVLRGDQLLSMFKINNPFELPINISGALPAGITLSPTNFSAAEQVITIQASGQADPAAAESTIEITTSGAVVCTLKIKYLGFQIVPIKFWKISDDDSNHITLMDEPGLNKLISISNDILGRQANVYIQPKGSVGALLNDLIYEGDLGDDISMDTLKEAAEPISDAMQDKELHILFAWHVVNPAKEGMVGCNFTCNDERLIVINTKDNTGDYFDMATTLVHELGHWISEAFIYPGDGTTTPCTALDRHFSHVQPDLAGCPGGDWTFFENLMVPDGPTIFISKEQAKAFNENADKVL